MASIAEYPPALWPRPRQSPVGSKSRSVVRRNRRTHVRTDVPGWSTSSPAVCCRYRQRCLFAAETVGDCGSVRKVYRDGDVATPCDPTRLGSHRRSRS